MEKPAETTTPEDEEKHSIPWIGIIAWTFVILILYVLSFGPVMMMMDKKRIPWNSQAMSTFYKPVAWAYKNTPLREPLRIYLHLWAPKRFDKNGDAGGQK